MSKFLSLNSFNLVTYSDNFPPSFPSRQSKKSCKILSISMLFPSVKAFLNSGALSSKYFFLNKDLFFLQGYQELSQTDSSTLIFVIKLCKVYDGCMNQGWTWQQGLYSSAQDTVFLRNTNTCAVQSNCQYKSVNKSIRQSFCPSFLLSFSFPLPFHNRDFFCCQIIQLIH